MRNNNSSRWVLWLVTGAAIVALMFVCGVGVLILRSQYQDEISLFLGGEPADTLATAVPPPTEVAAETGLDQEALQLTAVVVQQTAAADTATDAIDPAEQTEKTAEPTLTRTPSIVATATLAPQKPTEPPVPTATIPPSGRIAAFRTASPLAIDGNLAGWGDTSSYPAPHIVYTIGDWDETDDLQGYWRLAWDDNNLYVGVVVVDDTHVQNAGYDVIYQGDSVEIQIDSDLRGDYGASGSPDDYQLALSPGDFGGRAPSVWLWQGTAGGGLANANHAIQVAAVKTADGYVLEAAIPWGDVGVRPTNGYIIGIALNINDNDTIGTTRQEVMKSHIATRKFNNPSTWGQLILQP